MKKAKESDFLLRSGRARPLKNILSQNKKNTCHFFCHNVQNFKVVVIHFKKSI